MPFESLINREKSVLCFWLLPKLNFTDLEIAFLKGALILSYCEEEIHTDLKNNYECVDVKKLGNFRVWIGNADWDWKDKSYDSNFIRKMKLFTHNMLTSKMIRKVQVGYPLKLSATEVKITHTDFHPAFLVKMIPKLDWPVLVEAVQSIGKAEGLPLNLSDDYDKNEEFLKKAHHALFEIEVITGELECPETGRKFPISNGIPNMLANEDEV